MDMIELFISTHTLTWSVTLKPLHSAALMIDFNSHAHVERDLQHRYVGLKCSYFNSHAHVERDT